MKKTQMKNYLKLILLLYFGVPLFNVSAQEVEVEWGPIQKEIRNTSIDKIISNDDQGFYLLRTKLGFSGSKYFFERLNTDNVVEFSKEFFVKNSAKKQCAFENVFRIKGGFVVFMSYYDSKADKNILYAQTYSEEGESTSEPEEVDQIISKKRTNSGDFSTIISDNGSKILVYHQEPYQKNKNEKFNYKVYDNQLKLLWEKDMELPYKDKQVTIFDYTIDNDGYVYALEKVETQVKSSGLFTKNKKLYAFKIITYDFKADKTDEIPLSLGGAKFITDLTFGVDNSKGKIIVTGFFANKENSGIAGTVFIRIDKKTFKVEYENASAFDKKFLTKVYQNKVSERKAKKQESISTAYDLDHVIIKEDGGVIIVGEEYYVVERTSSSGSMGGISVTVTTYYYHYDNIIAINLAPDGTIKHANVIHKKQLSVNDGGAFSSFIMTYHNDNLYIWYNDNPKNIAPKTKPEKRGTYYMNKPKSAMVVMATIDKNGKLNMETFFKSKNEAKSILKPKVHATFASNKVLVYSENKSNYKFGFFKLSNK